MAGVPLCDVQELMGHKTIAMTCRHAHLAPSHLLAAVRHLDSWGKGSSATGTRTDTGTFESVGSAPAENLQVVVQ